MYLLKNLYTHGITNVLLDWIFYFRSYHARSGSLSF